MPDLKHLYAAADELVMGRLDVGDSQPPEGRASHGCPEVVAFTESHNLRSQAVMRRLGMSFVRTFRQPRVARWEPGVQPDATFVLYRIDRSAFRGRTSEASPQLYGGDANSTWVEGPVVVKRYRGHDAVDWLRVEVASLRRVAGVLPVPTVVGVDEPARQVRLQRLPGVHRQRMITHNDAAEVLQATGRLLRRLQDAFPGLVHGDFGPQNMLVDPAPHTVTGLLDWESAHDGDAVEDLAWAEWLVRTPHPDSRGSLGALFAGYGQQPPWPRRRELMLCRCAELADVCRRWGDTDAVKLWELRRALTAGWQE